MHLREVIRLCPNISEMRSWYRKVLMVRAEEVTLSHEELVYYTKLFKTELGPAKRFYIGGESMLYIEAPELEFDPVKVAPNHTAFQHVAVVVRDVEKAYERLKGLEVEMISKEPITIPKWNVAMAGVKEFYFRDPAGHPLECVSYPQGMTDPAHDKWQTAAGQDENDNILGIDHTAISVKDLAKSMDFYEHLGLQQTGNAHRYGREEERLTGVKYADIGVANYRGKDVTPRQMLDHEIHSYGVELLAFTKTAAAKDEVKQRYAALHFEAPPVTEATKLPKKDPAGHLLSFLTRKAAS